MTTTTLPDAGSPRRTSIIKRPLHTIICVVGALVLSAGLVGVTASPGSAATTTFTQSDGMFGGDPGFRFPSSGSISVPANPQNATLGPAAPYGSEIVVPYDAPVLDVNLELHLVHGAPVDLDLLLVGPGGQNALVMSDAGGAAGVNVTFDIDDEADTPIPAAAGPQPSTAYRPTNYDAMESFVAPAPAQVGNTFLGVFDGTSAAGTWRLYAMDDAASDVGTIVSWELQLALRSNPYPSRLDVDGLPPISDVDVTLQGFTSTFPMDMDVLLVSPGGKQATVLSDAGGVDAVSGLTLTLDDEAPGRPDNSVQLTSGTYLPTDDGPGTDQYGGAAPVPNGNTALSVFDGISPNGEWRLFFVDGTAGDVSTITGWSLEFTFGDTQSPTGSVSIDGGAAMTHTGAVTLNLGASDPAPSGGVTQMRFSNDGTSWSAYQPYAATAAWTLAPGDGTKTVFAQFSDADGNASAVVSDTIARLTADALGPRSVKASPTVGAKGVKVTSRVKVKASERLASASVTGKTVFLKAKGSSQRVRAKVAYVASSRTIVLTSRHHLGHHTKYRVTVKAVRDLAGNSWDQKPGKAGAQALTYTFTTA
jgi:subtilisin-like proprotein convertase family protein